MTTLSIICATISTLSAIACGIMLVVYKKNKKK